MIINTKKLKFMIINDKNVGNTYVDNFNIMINSICLKQVIEIKYLWVEMGKNLKMRYHAQNFTRKWIFSRVS